MRKLILIIVVMLISGCASTYFKARYEIHGEYLGESTKNNVVLYEEPRLFIESSPDGVTIDNDRIVVDTNQYKILARIDIVRNFETWDLGFSEYNESWRRYYCPPVVTLTYATLFLLGLTPAPYPCTYETSTSIKRIEQRKRNMIKEMLRKATEIGATHIVYATYNHRSSIESEAIIMPIGNMAMAVGSSAERELPYTGLSGIALRKIVQKQQ